MEDLELPQDFIEVNKEDTNYSMPLNYTEEFLSEKYFDWYFNNQMDIHYFSKNDKYELVKEVHLFKDLIPK